MGYGAAWNTLTLTRELLVQATDCTTSTATIQVGSGNAAQYIYNKGYYWTGSTWRQYTLTAAATVQDGTWYTGKASGNIELPQTVTYVVGYVCQMSNAGWKCGCRNSTCSNPYWQLQALRHRFTYTPPTGGDGGDGGGPSSGIYALRVEYENWPIGKYTRSMMEQDFGTPFYTDREPAGSRDMFEIVSDDGGGKALRTLYEGCVRPHNMGKPLPPSKEYVVETELRFSPNFGTAQKAPGQGKLWVGLRGTAPGVGYMDHSKEGQWGSSLMMYRNGNVNDGQQLTTYVYHMDSPTQYGDSFGRFGNKSPDWHHIKVYSKLNTPGVKNGIYQVWYDGQLVADRKDVRWIAAGSDWNWDRTRFLGIVGGNCNNNENYFVQRAYIDYKYHRVYSP